MTDHGIDREAERYSVDEERGLHYHDQTTNALLLVIGICLAMIGLIVWMGAK